MAKFAKDAEFQQQRGSMDVLYNSDEFRMYCFKVLPCSKHYSHDWTICPFAHPGEKARRRDPRVFKYAGVECPHVKEGLKCPRGDLCPFAHNIFECWLHPTRYRTQLCNEPASCKRKVCFFAHALEELREPSNPIDSLPEGGIGSGTAPLMSLDGLATSGAFVGLIPQQRQSIDVGALQHLNLSGASAPFAANDILSNLHGLGVQNQPQQNQQQLTQLLINLLTEIDLNGQQQQQLAKAQHLQQGAVAAAALQGAYAVNNPLRRWPINANLLQQQHQQQTQFQALAQNLQPSQQSVAPGVFASSYSVPQDVMCTARSASMESNIREALSQGFSCHGRVSVDNGALARAPMSTPLSMQHTLDLQQPQQQPQQLIQTPTTQYPPKRDSKKLSFKSIVEDMPIRSSEEDSSGASSGDVSTDGRRTENYPATYPLEEGDLLASVDCTLPESFILF